GGRDNRKTFARRQGLVGNVFKCLKEILTLTFLKFKSGQKTPRRWGGGTPLKKRTANRIRKCYKLATVCQQSCGVEVTFLQPNVEFISYTRFPAKTLTFPSQGILHTIKG